MTRVQLIIGSYTDTLPHVHGTAAGVLGSWFDPTAGALTAVTLLAPAGNPSFLAATTTGAQVYAVNETAGALTALSREAATGALTVLNTVASGGAEPCHVAVSPDDRFVLTAHYGSGSVSVHRREHDGSLGAMTARVEHVGTPGPEPSRQDGPHAHMICFDPNAGDVLVTDLGLDAVVRYRLDDGELSELGRLALAPGAGPRHAQFGVDGAFLYVVNELDNSVTTVRRDGASFVPVSIVSTLPAEATGHSQAAAIRVSPDGRLLFVSNRGHDSVAVLSLDAATGVPALAQVVPAHGRTPRDLIVSPDGRYLLVANQDSDTITVFAIGDASLELASIEDAATPVSLLLLP